MRKSLLQFSIRKLRLLPIQARLLSKKGKNFDFDCDDDDVKDVPMEKTVSRVEIDKEEIKGLSTNQSSNLDPKLRKEMDDLNFKTQFFDLIQVTTIEHFLETLNSISDPVPRQLYPKVAKAIAKLSFQFDKLKNRTIVLSNSKFIALVNSIISECSENGDDIELAQVLSMVAALIEYNTALYAYLNWRKYRNVIYQKITDRVKAHHYDIQSLVQIARAFRNIASTENFCWTVNQVQLQIAENMDVLKSVDESWVIKIVDLLTFTVKLDLSTVNQTLELLFAPGSVLFQVTPTSILKITISVCKIQELTFAKRQYFLEKLLSLAMRDSEMIYNPLVFVDFSKILMMLDHELLKTPCVRKFVQRFNERLSLNYSKDKTLKFDEFIAQVIDLLAKQEALNYPDFPLIEPQVLDIIFKKPIDKSNTTFWFTFLVHFHKALCILPAPKIQAYMQQIIFEISLWAASSMGVIFPAIQFLDKPQMMMVINNLNMPMTKKDTMENLVYLKLLFDLDIDRICESSPHVQIIAESRIILDKCRNFAITPALLKIYKPSTEEIKQLNIYDRLYLLSSISNNPELKELKNAILTMTDRWQYKRISRYSSTIRFRGSTFAYLLEYFGKQIIEINDLNFAVILKMLKENTSLQLFISQNFREIIHFLPKFFLHVCSERRPNTEPIALVKETCEKFLCQYFFERYTKVWPLPSVWKLLDHFKGKGKLSENIVGECVERYIRPLHLWIATDNLSVFTDRQLVLLNWLYPMFKSPSLKLAIAKIETKLKSEIKDPQSIANNLDLIFALSKSSNELNTLISQIKPGSIDVKESMNILKAFLYYQTVSSDSTKLNSEQALALFNFDNLKTSDLAKLAYFLVNTIDFKSLPSSIRQSISSLFERHRLVISDAETDYHNIIITFLMDNSILAHFEVDSSASFALTDINLAFYLNYFASHGIQSSETNRFAIEAGLSRPHISISMQYHLIILMSASKDCSEDYLQKALGIPIVGELLIDRKTYQLVSKWMQLKYPSLVDKFSQSLKAKIKLPPFQSFLSKGEPLENFLKKHKISVKSVELGVDKLVFLATQDESRVVMSNFGNEDETDLMTRMRMDTLSLIAPEKEVILVPFSELAKMTPSNCQKYLESKFLNFNQNHESPITSQPSLVSLETTSRSYGLLATFSETCLFIDHSKQMLFDTS